MKYRDENGDFQDLYLPPTGDTLPIGSEVDYNGEEVPYGWEEVTDPNSYSATEVKTNKTWVDGKPIYRRYWTGRTGTGNSKAVDTIPNYGECTGYFLKLVTATGGNWIGYLTSSVASGLQISVAGLMTIFKLGTEDLTYKLVVEYTKSTD